VSKFPRQRSSRARSIRKASVRIFAAALLLATFAGSAAAAENLGRLFLSPQQRQDLDRRRQANLQEQAPVIVERLVTVNGQVSRSSGKTTVWLNGVPEASARKPRDPARVILPGSENEPSVSLKVGQTIDKIRGGVTDPIGKGKIETPSDSRGSRP